MRIRQRTKLALANREPIQKKNTLVVDNDLGKLNPGGCYGTKTCLSLRIAT